MADDPQFNIEVVREFMVSKNFKVSNRELVSHFKPFLTHSAQRDANREKFRDYVNTLSTVKQDDKGEKVLVLKKKYRKCMPADLASDGLSAKKTERSVSPGSTPTGSSLPPTHSPAGDSSFNSTVSLASSSSASSPPHQSDSQQSKSSNNNDKDREKPNLKAPSVRVTKPSVGTDDELDGAGASKSSIASPTESDRAPQEEVFDATQGDNGEDVKPVPLPTSMSVKERARHLNKIESDSNLQQGSVKMRKHKKFPSSAQMGDKKDEDSSSVSSGGYAPMDQMDRDWMITISTGDYHPIHKLLTQKPELAKRRDFITFSALHWAAKHGKAEVVKLLCGEPGVNVNARSGYTPLHMAAMHGFEDIIELLVHGYNADPNLRDYSGKKPKQYLRNSASSRTHQILQARRPSSFIANGTQPFKRVGSYSAKIHKTGFFGIHGGSAMRSSWAAGSETGSDKDRASPSPSLSPSTSPRSSPAPSPRSRRKGSKTPPPRPPPPKLPPRPPPRRRKGSQSSQIGPSPLLKAILTERNRNSSGPSPGGAGGKPPSGKPPVKGQQPKPAKGNNENTNPAATPPTRVGVGNAAKPANAIKTSQSLDLSDIKEEESFESQQRQKAESNNSSLLTPSEQQKETDDSGVQSEPGPRFVKIVENGLLSGEFQSVFIPPQGESSDYDHDQPEESAEDEDEEEEKEEEAESRKNDDILEALVAESEKRSPKGVAEREDDDDRFSGVSFMDRLLGGFSNTEPEPERSEKDTRKDTAYKEGFGDKGGENEEDDWAQSLRSQSAFLMSSGFFGKKDEDQPSACQSRAYEDYRSDPVVDSDNNSEDPRTYQSAFLQSANLFRSGFEDDEEGEDEQKDRRREKDEKKYADNGEEEDMVRNVFAEEDMYQNPFLRSAGLFSGFDQREDEQTPGIEHDHRHRRDETRGVKIEPAEEDDETQYPNAFLQSAGLFGGFDREDNDDHINTSVGYGNNSFGQTPDRYGRYEGADRYGSSEVTDRYGRPKDTDRYGRSERIDRYGRSEDDFGGNVADRLRSQSAFLQSAGYFGSGGGSGGGGDSRQIRDITKTTYDDRSSSPYDNTAGWNDNYKNSSYYNREGYDNHQSGYRHGSDDQRAATPVSRPYHQQPETVDDHGAGYPNPFLHSAGFFGQQQPSSYSSDVHADSPQGQQWSPQHQYGGHYQAEQRQHFGGYVYEQHADSPDRYWSSGVARGGSDMPVGGATSRNPHQMAPYADSSFYQHHQLEENQQLVALPRRRQGHQQEHHHQQQEQPGHVAPPQDSPLPPPRRRRSQKEATREATGDQFSKSQDQDLMPPPVVAPCRKKRSRKDQDKENVNVVPRAQSVPSNLVRAGSNPEVNSIAAAPVTSPFI